MRSPTQTKTTPSFTPVSTGILQRKCASCGQHAIAGGECGECQKNRSLLQRQSTNREATSEVPPIVHEVLRSPGQPLDFDTRDFMESRFGQDFSQVQVHTDAKAAESARAVNALAYTVGQDIVFGASQYSPGTITGQKLLAHELTHTIQQTQFGLSNISQAKTAISKPDDIYEKEAEKLATQVVELNGAEPIQVQRQLSGAELQRLGDLKKVPAGLSCPIPVATSLPLPVVVDLTFNTNVSTLSKLQKDQIESFVVSWNALGSNTDIQVNGYASVDGPDELNWQLSCARAQAVSLELESPSSGKVPGVPNNRIQIIAYGETSEFSSNSLAPNRRATISTAAPLLPSCPPCPSDEPRPVECPPCTVPSSHICGPDIDSQLTKVLGEMQTHFRGLGGWEKHLSCQWLITPPMAIMAWDIHELFLPETRWLRMSPFSPPCGLPAAPVGGDVEDPSTCSNSVRVGGKCNLAGTANYATFGIMMKECYTYYSGSPTLPSWKVNIPFFTETGMKSFIGLYKTVTFDDPGPPTEFAEATYKSGSPSARPSTENRKHCSTACRLSATPPTFTFVWEPYKAR